MASTTLLPTALTRNQSASMTHMDSGPTARSRTSTKEGSGRFPRAGLNRSASKGLALAVQPEELAGGGAPEHHDAIAGVPPGQGFPRPPAQGILDLLVGQVVPRRQLGVTGDGGGPWAKTQQKALRRRPVVLHTSGGACLYIEEGDRTQARAGGATGLGGTTGNPREGDSPQGGSGGRAQGGEGW